jgi:DNA-directed RNA polymerase alpha subunit
MGSKVMRTPEQKAAAINAAWVSARAVLSRSQFTGRGLTDRTVDALIARGIDAPERLLFVTETDLRKIPGIGKVSVDEIMRYRARFVPEGQP